MIRSTAAPGSFCGTTILITNMAASCAGSFSTQPPMNWAAMFSNGRHRRVATFSRWSGSSPTKGRRTPSRCAPMPPRDYAVTSKGGDYTVHIVVGIDPENNLYVLDLWRAQATPDVWVERMLDLATQWKPISWAEEVGQIRASVGPFIERRMTSEKYPCTVNNSRHAMTRRCAHRPSAVACRSRVFTSRSKALLVRRLPAGIADLPRRQA